MRFAALILVSFFILSPVYAQSQSFDQMTLEELSSVDQKSLSKKEKKKLKKLIKKRQKEQKAAQKARQKRLKKYFNTYKRTEITGSKFDAHLLVRGPTKKQPIAGEETLLLDPIYSGHYHWFIRSYVYDDKSESHQLYVDVYYYREAGRGWRKYHTAAFPGGVKIDTSAISRETDECNFEGCRVVETLGARLSRKRLINAFKNNRAIELQLQAHSGSRITITIPAYYVQAYVIKMAETFKNFPAEIVQQRKAAMGL